MLTHRWWLQQCHRRVTLTLVDAGLPEQCDCWCPQIHVQSVCVSVYLNAFAVSGGGVVVADAVAGDDGVASKSDDDGYRIQCNWRQTGTASQHWIG